MYTFEADKDEQTYTFDISVTDPDTSMKDLEVEVDEILDDDNLATEVEILSSKSGYAVQFVRASTLPLHILVEMTKIIHKLNIIIAFNIKLMNDFRRDFLV